MKNNNPLLSFICILCILLLAMALSSRSYADLVHHYTFDDLATGGNATDSVGGANGTWDGNANANIAVPGILGTASQTNDENGGNGQEHYTTAALTGLDGASAVSISLWFLDNVAVNDNTSYNGLFMTRNALSSFGGGGENWGIAYEDIASPRHIDWRVNGAAGTETDDLVPGGWQHVVFVWDGNTGRRRLYVNGNLLADQAAPTGTMVNGNSWDIGNDTCCGNREFTGTLDDIAVFNEALDQNQVLALYQGGTPIYNAANYDCVSEPQITQVAPYTNYACEGDLRPILDPDYPDPTYCDMYPFEATDPDGSGPLNKGANPALVNDTPMPTSGDVIYDPVVGEYNFTANASMNMWTSRANAPIAWTPSPVVADGKIWFIETQVNLNSLDNVQVAGITFYGGPDNALPDFTFGLDNWNPADRRVRLQGLGDNNPNVPGALIAGNGAFLRVEVTEGGASDTYNFFYKENISDPWAQLGGVAMNFASNFANSRAGLFYKTQAARAGAVFSEPAVGLVDAPHVILADEIRATNDCLVTVYRTWRVEDCCGQADEALETYSYALDPMEVARAELPRLDLGCIGSTNQIPPPDFIAAGTKAECGTLMITQLMTQAIMTAGVTLDDCESGFERVYSITGSCTNVLVTQIVTYVLNTAPPVITNLAGYTNYGCQGDLRPILDPDYPDPTYDGDYSFDVFDPDGNSLIDLGYKPSLNFDTPNTGQGNVSYDGMNKEYHFTANGNLNMWTSRMNAPIAWTPSPIVAMGQTWFIETHVRLNNLSQDRQIAGITFYGGPDGALPDFGFQLHNWPTAPFTVRLQGHGDNNPNVGSGTLPGDSVFLRVEVTENGASDAYEFFYKVNAGDPWTSLTTYNSSIDNSRVGIFYKTNGAKDGAVFSEPAVGLVDAPHVILADEIRATNDCLVTVYRTWRVEDCCGQADEALEIYSYALDPMEVARAELPRLDLGCITSTNQIPPPDFIAAGTKAECGTLMITQLMTQAIMTAGVTLDDCESGFERVYSITGSCTNVLVTQVVTYTLNTASPQITEVAPYTNFGCAGDLRDPYAAVTVLDPDDQVSVNENGVAGGGSWPAVGGNIFVRERNNESSPELEVEAFLTFDLSGISAPISSATLELHQYDRLNTVNGMRDLFISRVLSAWDSGGPLPVHSEAGGATPVDSEFVFGNNGPTGSASVDITHVIDLTGWVNGWLTDPASNHGVRLRIQRHFVGAAFDLAQLTIVPAPDPTYGGLEPFAATDPDGDDTLVSTNLAMDMRMTNECQVTVFRTWRVEDCCGSWHEKVESYSYALDPMDIANARLRDLELGCITSTNQIPPPDFIEAGTMAECGNLAISLVRTQAITAGTVSGTFLSTDFSGRTVSGATAQNITWISMGVSDPGDLTAVQAFPEDNSTFEGLFDTASAQGYFAPNRNLGNEGPWSVDIPLAITAAQILLESVYIDWRDFDNNGNLQGTPRDKIYTVTLTDSSATVLGSAFVQTADAVDGDDTIVFAPAVMLSNVDTYTLTIRAEHGNDSGGNNSGLDAIALNGTVTPMGAVLEDCEVGFERVYSVTGSCTNVAVTQVVRYILNTAPPQILAVAPVEDFGCAGDQRPMAALSDNFYAEGTPDTTDVNYGLGLRQIETVSTVSYTVYGTAQVGNPELRASTGDGNYLRLSGGANRVSPNLNFNGALSDGGLEIRFDVAPHDTANASHWAGICLGMPAGGRDIFMNQNAVHFGLLFRADGRIQAFDGNTVVSAGEVWHPDAPLAMLGGTDDDFHSVRLVLTDPTDGQPFDGAGETRIEVYSQYMDGGQIPLFTFTKTGGGYADNYINFHANQTGGIDDLRVMSIPDPTYGGLYSFVVDDPDGAETIVSTQLVREIRTVHDCQVIVTRTWRVEDCCGDWHEADEVYTYDLPPEEIAGSMLPDLDLGCIESAAQIPPPDFIEAGTSASCGSLSVTMVSATVVAPSITSINYVPITGDADAGIHSLNTYTHAIDFGQGTPGANINGVQFVPYNAAADGTFGFNRAVNSGSEDDHAGNANHNVSGNLADLLTDMYYNGGNSPGGTTTWTLSGLTPGTTYETRIYTRQWGASNNRDATFVFDPDGAGPISDATGLINQDDATTVGFSTDNQAYYINYRFTAVAGEDLVITVTQSNPAGNNSWHLYGLSNQEVYAPDCATTLQRVYDVATACTNMLVTQDVVYVLNTAPPQILAVAPVIDYGCLGDQRQIAYLSDNYFAEDNPDLTDVNFGLAPRQVESPGVLTYSTSGTAELGNPTMRAVAGDGNYLYSSGWGKISPDMNFSGTGGLEIRFDVAPDISMSSTDWTAINLGMVAGDRFVNVNGAASHFGLLFRSNGGAQAFDGGTVVENTTWSTTGNLGGDDDNFHSVRLVITDPTDGDPFDGVGQTRIEAYSPYVDGGQLPFLTFIKGGGGYASNYINFQSITEGGIDNLRVAAMPDPTYNGAFSFVVDDPDGPATIVSTQLVREIRTVHDCQVTVTRTWRVEDCCGQWHEADEVYTYNLTTTDIMGDGLPLLDVGCVDSLGDIPPADFDSVGLMAECGSVKISRLPDQPTTYGLADCEEGFERVYQVEATCGTSLVTQVVIYVLNTGAPQITNMAAYTNAGCQGDPRPLVPILRNIEGLFNTGVDNAGLALGDNIEDPHYELTTDPSGAGSATIPNVWPIAPGVWVANTANSRWIGPNAAVGSHPAGTYVYTTTFTLPSHVDVSSVQITGAWATDNPGTAIYLNGVATGETNPGPGTFQSLHPFSLSGAAGHPFQPGINTLSFEVSNAATSPTGLRVDNIAGTYVQFDPTYNNMQPFDVFDPDGNDTVISTQLVREVRMTNNCEVSVTRTWRVEDCCGAWHEADETYHYLAVPVPPAMPLAGVDFANSTGGYDTTPDDLDPSDAITVSGWTFTAGGGLSNDGNAQTGRSSTPVGKFNGENGAAQPAVGDPPPANNIHAFSITVPAGYQLHLADVSFDFSRATGGGDQRWLAFRTSLDSTLLYSQVGPARSALLSANIDLGGAPYQGLENQTVTFYWYAGGPGSGDIDIDSIVIRGSVSSPTQGVIMPPLHVGCISSTNQIPPIDLTREEIETHCYIQDVSFIETQSFDNAADLFPCTSAFYRVYEVATLCTTSTVSQLVTYVLNTAPPFITFQPGFTNYGCRGDLNPLEAVSAPIITRVVNNNSLDAGDVYATGSLAEDVDAFIDRTHEYNGPATMTGIPAELIGADYILTANDDKTAGPGFSVDVTLSSSGFLYLFIDRRVNVAAVMPWVAAMGFEATGAEIGIDEGGGGTGPGNSLDNFSTVYRSPLLLPGTYQLFEQNDGGGRNMYGIAALALVPPSGLVATDPDGDQTIIRTQFVGEVRSTNGCEVSVTRTWRVEDCCGRWHEADERYAYTLALAAGDTWIDFGDHPRGAMPPPQPGDTVIEVSASGSGPEIGNDAMGLNFGGLSIAVTDTDADGNDVGQVDWRDRGDSTAAGDLVDLGETFTKNNLGIIRVTIWGLPKGSYRTTSFHEDSDHTQATDIRVLLDDDGDGVFEDTGAAGSDQDIGNENNLSDGVMAMGSAEFTVISDGQNPVRIIFDATLSADDEVPLNGLHFAPIAYEEVDVGCLLATNNLNLVNPPAYIDGIPCRGPATLAASTPIVDRGCDSVMTNFWLVEAPCSTVTVTQVVFFTINTGAPVITNITAYTNYGCNPEPTNLALAAQSVIGSAVNNGSADPGDIYRLGFLAEDVLAFVDRTHEYNGPTTMTDIPAFLNGAHYVVTANDDKTQGPGFSVDVSLTDDGVLFLFIDNRVTVASAMPWVAANGFTDTGFDIGVDEGGDGDIDNTSSIYASPILPAGTYQVFEQNDGGSRNMYGIAALAAVPVPARLEAADPDGNDTIILTNLVRELRITNDCQVTVTRTWRVEDCCGRWHEADEIYSYTLIPSLLTVEALAPLNLECVDSPDDVPPPSDLLIQASSSCSVVSIEWLGDTPTTPQLIGHWSFDEGSGLVAGDGVNGNDGVWTPASGAGLNWGAGQSGAAADLSDAANNQNYFTVTSIPQLSGANGMTISAWVRPEGQNTSYNGIFMSRTGGSWGLAFEDNNDNFDGRTPAGGGLDSPAGFTPNNWYHVTYTWDGTSGERRMYVDGNLVSSDSNGTIGSPPTGPWTIGFDNCCGGNRSFEGMIDEAAMWDGPLSAGAVRDVYTHGVEARTCLDSQVTLERVYAAVDLCGQTQLVTQSISYVLNTAPPIIAEVAPNQDYGCVGDPRPIVFPAPNGLQTFFTFNGPDAATVTDDIGGHIGTLLNSATLSAPGTGRSGRPDDRALDVTASSSASLHLIGDAWSGNAVANDRLTISFWQRDLDPGTDSNDTSFYLNSPTVSNCGTRGALGHVPWGDGIIYWDTAGCSTASRRLSETAPASSRNNDWHHYVFVKDGTFKAIYVDGVRLTSSSGNIALAPYSEMWIGAEQGAQNSLNGFIDDFAILDEALDPATIAALAAGADLLPDPTYDGSEPFVASDADGNILSTSLVQNVYVTNGCQVTVFRTWRVEDCCGLYDEALEIYSFQLDVGDIAQTLPELDLGCISSTDQIPYAGGITGACPDLTIIHVGDQVVQAQNATFMTLPLPLASPASYAESEFNGSYVLDNMIRGATPTFGVAPAGGAGNEYASQGTMGVGDRDPLIFLDYGVSITANSIGYAQRAATGGNGDNITSMLIWFEDADPAGVPPARAPDVQISPNPAVPTYLQYDFGAEFSGRYVVIYMQGGTANPGGRSMRLGYVSGAVPVGGSDFQEVGPPAVFFAESEYNGSYLLDNLFDDQPVFGLAPISGAGWEFASQGNIGVLDRDPVIFLDYGSVVTANALGYAQRAGLVDQASMIRIWFEATDPGTNPSQATLPNRTPDAIVTPNVAGGDNIYRQYDLGGTFSSQYVVMEFLGSSWNPGGTEMRLGYVPPSVAHDMLLPAPVNVVANSEFDWRYAADNMFDQNVSFGDTPQALPFWEYASRGITDPIVVMDFGSTVLADFMGYAQRPYGQDQVNRIDLWFEDVAPFGLSVPARPADVTINPTQNDFRFLRYDFPTTQSGQYVIMQLNGGVNPGATEFRLGSTATTCESTIDRVYQVTSGCGAGLVTQRISYVLNTGGPEILDVASYTNYGCVTEDPRPLATSLAAIVTTDPDWNIISGGTTLVSEVRITEDCLTIVTRTWRVVDCCGLTAERTEQYAYMVPPQDFAAGNFPDLNLGCIRALDQIPPPDLTLDNINGSCPIDVDLVRTQEVVNSALIVHPVPVSVAASSFFSGSFLPDFLFDGNPSFGSIANLAGQYAGSGLGPHVLALDFGSEITMSGLGYAQRLGGMPSADKVIQMEIWFLDSPGSTTAPATPPDVILPITHIADATYTAYDFSDQGIFTSQYVVMRLTGNSFNPGGSELRMLFDPVAAPDSSADPFGCQSSLQRVYRVATDCTSVMITQTVHYILEEGFPEITDHAPGIHWGCQTNDWLPPTNFAALAFTNVPTQYVQRVITRLEGQNDQTVFAGGALQLAVPPVASSFAVNGGDSAEWDLSGTIVAAANIEGDNQDFTVQGINFPWVHGISDINIVNTLNADCLGAVGSIGPDLEDENLRNLVGNLHYGNAMQLSYSVPVGRRYMVDLVSSSGNCGARGQDIRFNGIEMFDSVVAPAFPGTEVFRIEHCAYQSDNQIFMGDSASFGAGRPSTGGANPNDPNAVLGAVVIRDIGPCIHSPNGVFTTLVSKAASNAWQHLTVSENIPAAGSIFYTVRNPGGTVFVTGQPSVNGGIDLSGIPDSETNLIIQVDLATTDPLVTPRLFSLTAAAGRAIPIEENPFLTITDVSVTNDCEVTVIRTFRVEDCCGNFDEEDAYHTYTIPPEPPETARYFVYVGCINDLDAVPGLEEATLEPLTNGCEHLELAWVSNSPPRTVPFDDFVLPVSWFETIDPGLYNQQTNRCLTWYDRVYSLTDLCGQSASVTQTVAYTLDQHPPRIVSVSNHVDYGCATEDPRPVETSLNAVVVEHLDETVPGTQAPYFVSLQMESRFTNDCFVQVFRTWRAEDCCGSYDLKQETYSYIHQIDDLNVQPLAPLHLECINNTNAIPLPEPDLVIADATCPLESVEWIGDTAPTNSGGCTSMIIRSYMATDNCGGTAVVSQQITFVVDQLPPVIENWPANTNLGCQALMPDPVPVANLTNDLVVSDDSLVTWRTNDDSRVTNGCEVTVTRRWVIRDCCGRLDERATEYTFTILPDAVSIDALADKYIGCITHTNQLPEPNVTLINASSACSVVTLDYLGEQNSTNRGCTSSVDRVYQATDLCGQTNSITQTVSWTLEPDQPEILDWELDADWGCQDEGWRVPADTNALVATNVIGDATWTDVYTTNDCTVHLRRTWRVENCCWYATVESDHTFTIRPSAATIAALAPLDIGCIHDMDQIPQPNETILSVSSVCGVADIAWLSNGTVSVSGCTSRYDRVYAVEDICGQWSHVTQQIFWVLQPTPPMILSVEPAADWGCRDDGFTPLILTNAFEAMNYTGEVAVTDQRTTNDCLITLLRTFQVKNCCGESAQATVLHTWTLRPPAPVVLGLELIDLGCVADASTVPDVDAGSLEVISACGGVDLVYLTNTPATQVTECIYELTRTFRATDTCNQMVDFVRTIRYRIDTMTPAVVSLPGGHLGCAAAGETPTNLPSYADDEAAMIVIEDCDYAVSLVAEFLYTNNPCLVQLVRTYRVHNACNDVVIPQGVTYTWTESDGGPVITGPTRRALGCINSTASIPDPSTAPFSVSGQCEVVEFDHLEDTDHVLSSNQCTWSFDRVYFARDICDEVTTYTQQVFYILLSRPEILETEEGADLGCVFGEPDLPAAIVSVAYVGNVPGGPTVTSNIVTNGCERTLTRTYRIVDCCGSFDEESVTFTWISGPDPAAIDGPMLIEMGCIDSVALIPEPNTSRFVVDANCGARIIWNNDSSPTTNGCTVSIDRTFNLIDICNRTSDFVQAITYSLRGPHPDITSVPAGQDFGCLSAAPDIPADSNAVSWVGTNIELSYSDVYRTNGCEVTLTRTWRADNCCGDFDEAAVVYTWIQPSPPVLTPPVGFIFEDDLGCNPDFSNLPLIDVTRFEVESSCGATARVYHASDERVFSGCTGTLIRTYTASDTCGNYTSVVQTFTFTVDTQAPTNIAVNAGGDLPCGMAVPAPDVGLVSVGEENCPGEVEISVDSVSTARTVCAEVITHTYRVADACGNDRLVSVHWNRPVDDEAPVLTCPDPVEVETGVDCYAPVPEIVPDWTDNCGEVTVSQVPKIGTTLPGPSTQEVTVTVSDACGNSTSCVVQLIINSGCGEGGYLIPDVAIDKRVALGSGVDCATAVEKVSWTNGAAVTWCFRITNTGQVELQNVQLSDPLLGVSQQIAGSLAAGQNTGWIAIDGTIAGSHINTATVTGLPVNGRPPVSAADDAEVEEIAPPLELLKTVRLGTPGDGGQCPGVELVEGFVGDAVVYCFEIRNNGQTVIDNVRLRDDQLGIDLEVAAQLASGQSVFYSAASTIGGALTNTAWASGRVPTGPMTGTVANPDTAVVDLGAARIAGVVWEDARNDGFLDESLNLNLEVLGLVGVDVCLYEVVGQVEEGRGDGYGYGDVPGGRLIRTATTGSGGSYEFDGLPAGDYFVEVHKPTVALPSGAPPLPTTAERFETTLVRGDDKEGYNFGFREEPTAVRLTALEAVLGEGGVVVQWTAGSQSELLGYRVSRKGEVISPLIPSRGAVGTYGYTVVGATGGRYTLEAVGIDLEAEALGSALTQVDAAPQGEPSATVQAESNQAVFTSEAGVTTYFVYEFDTEPTVTDLTHERELKGQVIEVDGKYGVYFSPTAGAEIRVE